MKNVKQLLVIPAMILGMTAQLAHAELYTGELDFTVMEYPVTIPGTNLTGDAAADYDRNAFDSGDGGAYDLTFSAEVISGSYNSAYGMLAFGITDDPQDALVADLSQLMTLTTATTEEEIDTALNTLFTGNYWIVYGLQASGQTYTLNDFFTTPLVLEADTTYYPIVAGGSLTSGVLEYSLDVSPLAVPEPASFAILGIGLIGVATMNRRRRHK